MHTRCFHYLWKSGSPSQNFSTVEAFQKCNPQDFKFYLSKLIGKIFPPVVEVWFELQHDKTNKVACVPSKDSDQPGHPPSLIRVIVVRMKKAWVLSYPLSASEDSDQSEWMPMLWLILCLFSVLFCIVYCSANRLQINLQRSNLKSGGFEKFFYHSEFMGWIMELWHARMHFRWPVVWNLVEAYKKLNRL